MGKAPSGEPIVCDECGQPGKTLIKKGSVYVHQVCPHRPAVLDPSTGLIIPPPMEFPVRKVRRRRMKARKEG